MISIEDDGEQCRLCMEKCRGTEQNSLPVYLWILIGLPAPEGLYGFGQQSQKLVGIKFVVPFKSPERSRPKKSTSIEGSWCRGAHGARWMCLLVEKQLRSTIYFYIIYVLFWAESSDFNWF